MSDHITDFLGALKDAGRSDFTITAYRKTLRAFERAHVFGSTWPIDAEIIRTYLRQFAAPASRRLHLAALRKFYAYLVGAGVVVKTPLGMISMPAPPTRPPRALTEDEEQALFTAAATRPDVMALLHLLRYSGLRVGEITGYREKRYDPYTGVTSRVEIPGLRLGDLDLNRLLLVLRGKGGDWAPMFMTEETRRWIEVYLTKRRGSWLGTAPLFTDFMGRPRGTDWAQGVFRRLRKRAGCERRITPHMLRHTFGVRFLEAGGDWRAIQQLLRHKTMTTTMIYAAFTRDAALRRQYDQYVRGVTGDGEPHQGDGARLRPETPV